MATQKASFPPREGVSAISNGLSFRAPCRLVGIGTYGRFGSFNCGGPSAPPLSAQRPAMNGRMNMFPISRRRGGMIVGLVVCLVIASITGWIGYAYWYDADESVSAGELITRQVSRGPFDHVVLQQGEIESSSNIEIICEVSSRGSSGVQILWVIDEGARVKAGDKLVEIDSSSLEIQLKDARLKVLTAESSVKSAEAILEQAKIAKREYLEGTFLTEKMAITSEQAKYEQQLRKAELALQSTLRLVGKGLMKELQLDADKFAVVDAKNQLAAAEQRLDVLENLTRQRMLVQYESDIESAETRLQTARSSLEEEEAELAEIEQQIESCVMYAPSDGVVVHANRYSRRGGNAEFVVEPGAVVRERQAIIRLPDPTQMQVKCNVNESQITLIDEGMPAKITIDALPGLRLRGRVVKVNRYAEPGGWMSSSVKEYATTVEIIDPPETIRTGMNAAVEIFVEQLPDSLQIPIQGLYEHGGEMYTLIKKPVASGARGTDRFETRVVEIGATNDTMASIRDGLEDGETVVLNLRQHLTLLDLPPIEREDNSDLKDIRRRESASRLTSRGESGASTGGGGDRPRRGGANGGNRRGGRGPGGGGSEAEGGAGSDATSTGTTNPGGVGQGAKAADARADGGEAESKES